MSLGPVGSKALKSLIDSAHIGGQQRLANKANILKAIQSGMPLKGCVKAKKDDTNATLDEIANTHASPNGAPNLQHPIMRLLQASAPQPVQGKTVTLKNGYVGDELELAREFSMIMLIDAVTQQWDRYSGGNVVIRKDDQGHAHFYATDNGGADIASSWSPRNLSWFSRFDRSAVQKLTDIKKFLDAPATGYLGYTDPKVFVVDLGFYSLMGAGCLCAAADQKYRLRAGLRQSDRNQIRQRGLFSVIRSPAGRAIQSRRMGRAKRNPSPSME